MADYLSTKITKIPRANNPSTTYDTAGSLAEDVAKTLGCNYRYGGDGYVYLYSDDCPIPWGAIAYKPNRTGERLEYRVAAHTIKDKRSRHNGHRQNTRTSASRDTARKIAVTYIRKPRTHELVDTVWGNYAAQAFNNATYEAEYKVRRSAAAIGNEHVVKFLANRFTSGDTFADDPKVQGLLSTYVDAVNSNKERTANIGKNVSFVQVFTEGAGGNVFRVCNKPNTDKPNDNKPSETKVYTNNDLPSVIAGRIAVLMMCPADAEQYVDMVGMRISENTFFIYND